MPENGMLNEQRVTYHCRDSVTFSCEDGYGIMGPTTIMCREDGTWDNTFPTCVEKTCPELEEVKNAKTNYTNKGILSFCKHFKCILNSVWRLRGLVSLSSENENRKNDLVFHLALKPYRATSSLRMLGRL